MIMSSITFTLIVASFICGSNSLILDTVPCEASPPCTCSVVSHRQHVNCDTKGISSVPAFHNTSSTLRDIYLDLSNNDISTIKTYAFKFLNHTRLNSFFLYLENNKISTIEKDAFLGVSNPMRELYLANNKLTTISGAFSDLINLNYLDIRNNSIVTYDPRAMTGIGRNLRTLFIGSADMQQWPTELHYLRYLQTLNVYYTHLTALPQDAFHGFESTLQTLRIDSTRIGSINPAICYLINLQNFYFDNNKYTHGHRSIFSPCLTQITSLKLLHISNDGLEQFPPVFFLFPSLTKLYVINNPGLFYVDDSSIPANAKVVELYLYNNGFTRVPEAVQKMQLLEILDLHGNRIRLVEAHDVADMDTLQRLRLDGNGIEFISEMSFQNLPQMQYLYLNGTHITDFPAAVPSMTDLRELRIPDDQIECNCDALGFLKNWNMHRLNIIGKCEASTDRVHDFIRNNVRGCPSQ